VGAASCLEFMRQKNIRREALEMSETAAALFAAKDVRAANEIIREMRRLGVGPDVTTYRAMLRVSMAATPSFERVRKAAIRSGHGHDAEVLELMLARFASTNERERAEKTAHTMRHGNKVRSPASLLPLLELYVRADDPAKAEALFGSIENKTVREYSHFLRLCLKARWLVIASRTFRRSLEFVRPDRACFSTMIKVCAQQKDRAEVMKLARLMRTHRVFATRKTLEELDTAWRDVEEVKGRVLREFARRAAAEHQLVHLRVRKLARSGRLEDATGLARAHPKLFGEAQILQEMICAHVAVGSYEDALRLCGQFQAETPVDAMDLVDDVLSIADRQGQVSRCIDLVQRLESLSGRSASALKRRRQEDDAANATVASAASDATAVRAR